MCSFLSHLVSSLSPAEFRSKTDRELASCSYWRRTANRISAEGELAGKPLGAFVVRPSSQDRCLALSHVIGSAGSIGHGIIHFHGDGYSLEANPDRYPSVDALLHSLPLRFDIWPDAGSAVAAPPTPASPAKPVAAQPKPAAPTSTPPPAVVTPAPAAMPPSSLSRESFRRAEPGAAPADAVAAKLARIREALVDIVGEMEATEARVEQTINSTSSDIHALVPIATLFKAVRPTLEKAVSVVSAAPARPGTTSC